MTSNATGRGRILDSSLRSGDGKGIVRMQDSFDTDMEDVSSALTDLGRLARRLGSVEGDMPASARRNVQVGAITHWS